MADLLQLLGEHDGHFLTTGSDLKTSSLKVVGQVLGFNDFNYERQDKITAIIYTITLRNCPDHFSVWFWESQRIVPATSPK